jgi:uncharacterized protein
MKEDELKKMSVAELKAVAKKKNVSLPAGAKKTDIVAALKVANRVKRPSIKKSGSVSGRVAKKKATAKETLAKKKSAADRQVPSKKNRNMVSTVCEWKVQPGIEEPQLAQERVSESKYYTGPEQQLSAVAYGDLPQGYGEEKVTLMSRDPFVAYAYWEMTSARIEREKAWFGWDAKLCVRVYDVTGVQFDGRNAIGYYDHEISDNVGTWYVDLGRPRHSFCADLGLLSSQGKFLTLVRSNYITMPRSSVSDVVDNEWMLQHEEFMKLYGIPSGLSSPQIQEMMKRRLTQEISSPGTFTRSRAKRK